MALTSSIDLALEALDGGNLDAAIDHLLVAWRASRSIVLADAIDAVTARLAGGVSPLEGRTHALRHKAWLKREASRRHADISMLLENISQHEVEAATAEVKRLMRWDLDPRVTRPLAFLLKKPVDRFGVSKTQRFSVLVGTVLNHHLDPRVPDLVDRDKCPWQMREMVMTMFAASRTIAKDFPMTEADELAIERVRVKILVPLADEHAKAQSSIADLYQAVYDNPNDDAPRLVLSDALQQSGDPRGEIIALMIGSASPAKKGGKTRAQRQAEALIERHKDELLGNTRLYVKEARFERGFLSGAIVSYPIWDKGTQKWKRVLPASLVGDPAWSTVHTLYFSEIENMDVVASLLNHPSMRALREVGLIGRGFSDEAAMEQIRTLDRLGFVVPTTRFHFCGLRAQYDTGYRTAGFSLEDISFLATTPTLERVTHLGLHGHSQASYVTNPLPEHFDWLWQSPLGQRLEELTLVVHELSLDSWMRRAEQSGMQHLARLTFVRHHFSDDVATITIHRGGRTKTSAMRSIEGANLDADWYRQLAWFIENEAPLDELTLHGRAPIPRVRKYLDQALKKHRPQKTNLPG